jgi:histidine triad (HIT) family protein
MATIFTQIIKGEIPCHKILENDTFFSFLDINPINPGHTLVVPKKEIDYLFHLDDELLSEILVFSKRIVPALEKVVPCNRVGIMVAGLDVPHAHVHLIPIMSEGDLTFDRARPGNPSELAGTANKIRKALASMEK